MGEVSDEIELDLGLSIGGSFNRSENPKPIESDLELLESRNGAMCKELETGLTENSHAPPGSVVDPQKKREIHALRWQEAKRKREKQQKRGHSRGKNGEVRGNGGSPVSGDDEVEGFDAEEVELKKNKIESNGSMSINGGSEQMGYASSSPYPVMQMQFPYPPIQYVPLSNGFAIPYVMPCWAPNGAAAGGGCGGAGNEKVVACRSFVPFQANLQNGAESEQNGSGGNRKATSNGSNLSSSVVSDNRSSSHEGANSGETRSNSSHSPPDQPKIQFERSTAPSNMLHPNPAGPNGEANGSMHIKKEPEVLAEAAPPESNNKPISPPENHRESKAQSGKPPKPQTQNHLPPNPQPQMPCVSTTGNGPDGKTITGFLYRYTKNEVSIICVCHGSSFSPAEFVAHAGGTDVTNPLKHITVIPSAFG